MSADAWLEETYFDWLRQDAFTEPRNRREYEGVLRVLHEVPFYWLLWSDENRAGDALNFRQFDFLGQQKDLDRLDQVWLNAWAQASPTVLEVLLGMARRWSLYFGGSVSFYFGHLFKNLGMDHFPGRVLASSSQNSVRELVDTWLSRNFETNGKGSPFPSPQSLDVIDMRHVDMWGQMNAYSAEFFQ